MRPSLLAAALSGAAVLSLAAGAWAQDATIPVIVKDTTSPFWQTVLSGACHAGKDLGVEVPLLGPTAESDIAGQIDALENAVSQNPAAVVIAPTSFDALGPAIDEAAGKVPVVGIDSLANSEKQTSFLTTDNVQGGRMAADALAAAIEAQYGAAEGQVAIVSYIAGPSSLRDRIAGFTEQLATYPGLEIVTTRIGDGQTTTALNNTIDVMSAFPDLRGIFDDALFTGLGSGQAVAEAGKQDQIMIVSFDSSDQLVTFLSDGTIKGLIVQDPYRMGYEGVKTALAASNGEEVPDFIDTGANLITKDNMNETRAQELLTPDLDCS